ncbi:phage tail assembly chaperone G [Peribacillus frigoritolerans]|uniref:phage tail assembly chaperone G n=1 Tax=Peribacillus frigoritolerans TaxID=450367 RepID=UPI00330648D6
MANLKRNMIELVKEVKEGEIVTEKHLTPIFIPFSVVYEAVDLTQEMEKSEKEKNASSEKEMIDKLLEFVANKIYNKQFTKEDLFNGLHAPDAIQTLQEQIIFVAQGRQTDETKKFLAKKG